MVIAYIGIGSNLGDRLYYLQSGVEALDELGTVLAVSGVYETEPVGVESPQPHYLNMVVAVEMSLSPPNAMARLLTVERENQRESHERNAARTLDLDLLSYGDEIIDTPLLTLPHPRLYQRAFVLAPLAEIAPDFLHPATGFSVTEMLARVGCQHIEKIGELADLTSEPRILG